MFTIWQEDTEIVKVSSAFEALAHMKKYNIDGKIKDEAGETIISWAKLDGTNWENGLGSLPLGISEAAILMGLSYIRVNQFCNKGRLGHKSTGGQWFIMLDELQKFAARERLSGVGFNQKNRKELNNDT